MSSALWSKKWSSTAAIVFYLMILLYGSWRCTRTPFYQLDILGYIGNALLVQDRDPVSIHRRAYLEIKRGLPEIKYRDMLGELPGSEDSVRAKKDRAANPDHFMEYLPFFAIRPIYNRLLYVLGHGDRGFVRAAILISSVSYFFLGSLVFIWMSHYVKLWHATAFASLLMLSPPITFLGRFVGSDCLSTVTAFFSLFLIFEKRYLVIGLVFLLGSIYVRTDNVVLAGILIFICMLEKRVSTWKAAVLALTALTSALLINHAAGDYGIKMLYFRNFLGTPLAPAETIAHFTLHDYIAAFRAGISNAADSFLIPFLFLGLVGFSRSGITRTLVSIALLYTVLHYIVLPNWQDRWFGVFYIVIGLAAACAVAPKVEDMVQHGQKCDCVQFSKEQS